MVHRWSLCLSWRLFSLELAFKIACDNKHFTWKTASILGLETNLFAYGIFLDSPNIFRRWQIFLLITSRGKFQTRSDTQLVEQVVKHHPWKVKQDMVHYMRKYRHTRIAGSQVTHVNRIMSNNNRLKFYDKNCCDVVLKIIF